MRFVWKVALTVAALAGFAYIAVDSTCIPKGPAEYKCEFIWITSRYCPDQSDLQCFNRRRSNNFSLPFCEPPPAIIGIETWDVNASNARLRVWFDEVTNERAMIIIQSWKDTWSYSSRTNVFACGYLCR